MGYKSLVLSIVTGVTLSSGIAHTQIHQERVASYSGPLCDGKTIVRNFYGLVPNITDEQAFVYLACLRGHMRLQVSQLVIDKAPAHDIGPMTGVHLSCLRQAEMNNVKLPKSVLNFAQKIISLPQRSLDLNSHQMGLEQLCQLPESTSPAVQRRRQELTNERLMDIMNNYTQRHSLYKFVENSQQVGYSEIWNFLIRVFLPIANETVFENKTSSQRQKEGLIASTGNSDLGYSIKQSAKGDVSLKVMTLAPLNRDHGKGETRAIGFEIRNRGSPTINPAALQNANVRSERSYSFTSSDPKNMGHKFAIDDSNGNSSNTRAFKHKVIYLFPRKQSFRLQYQNDKLVVTLPTSEVVDFDPQTLEVLSGPIKEKPINMQPNPPTRGAQNGAEAGEKIMNTFAPSVEYTGTGLAIESASLAESPERTTCLSAHAVIKYNGQKCSVLKSEIWDIGTLSCANPDGTEGTLNLKFPNDLALFNYVEQKCGWDLTRIKSN